MVDSDDLSNIEKVEDELNAFISQIENGKAPNPTKLLLIETELETLVKNENIPESVKQSLIAALQNLTSDEPGGLGTIDLYSAKNQIDQALEKGKQSDQ